VLSSWSHRRQGRGKARWSRGGHCGAHRNAASSPTRRCPVCACSNASGRQADVDRPALPIERRACKLLIEPLKKRFRLPSPCPLSRPVCTRLLNSLTLTPELRGFHSRLPPASRTRTAGLQIQTHQQIHSLNASGWGTTRASRPSRTNHLWTRFGVRRGSWNSQFVQALPPTAATCSAPRGGRSVRHATIAHGK